MNDSVAVVAAHPDDEVLGCGGTIAGLADAGRQVHVLFIADGETARDTAAPTVGRVEVRRAAAATAARVLGCASTEFLEFPDNRLDSVPLLDLVKQVERFLSSREPGTVFTHHSGDLNVDHRMVHDAVVTACRPIPGRSVESLLFFEVPSSTEWRPCGADAAFVPNWFVDVSGTLARKLEALRAYGAELRDFPHPRSLKAVEALATWRGASAGLRAAEAFVLGRRIVTGLRRS